VNYRDLPDTISVEDYERLSDADKICYLDRNPRSMAAKLGLDRVKGSQTGMTPTPLFVRVHPIYLTREVTEDPRSGRTPANPWSDHPSLAGPREVPA